MCHVGRVCLVGCLERADCLAEVDVFLEEEFFVSGFEGFDVLLGEAPALQADDVEATDAGRISIYDGVWWDILNHFCEAADDGMAADAAELVGGGKSGDDRVVFHHHVASETGGTG